MRAGRSTIRTAVVIALLAGSAIGVSAQEDAPPRPPVEYTAKESGCGTTVRDRSAETLEVGGEGMVLTRDRGGVWSWSREASDPRLEGTVYHSFESDTYGSRATINVAPLRIENDQGAWVSMSVSARLPDGTSLEPSGPTVYVGEGAFDGLIAVEESTASDDATCTGESRGIIFEGAPALEAYRPE